MEISDRSGMVERVVLVGQLTDDTVCGRIASQWPSDGGLYGSKYANLLGKWATNYYLRYGEAPKDRIMGQFARWSEKTQDAAAVTMVSDLLSSLSDDWTRTPNSSEYTLDQAQDLFSDVALRRTASRIQACLDSGDVEEAKALLTQATTPQLSGSSWYNPLTDAAAITEAFEAKREPLVVYPGDLGIFLGSTLERDAFVAFRGIAKVGKSFTLMDIAYQALKQRRRVAYLAIGDMSKQQVDLRWSSRITRRPRVASTVQIPISWDDDADPMQPIPVCEDRVFSKSLRPEDVMAVSATFIERNGLDADCFRVSIHASRSISVFGLHAILRGWEREGWVPDCIAEGSLVLTDRGLVPIQHVLLSDRLWDGVDWVSHHGVICKGIKNVITYAGLTATPDHMVQTDYGWRTFEQCRRLGLRIAATGFGGKAVRLGDRYTADSTKTVPQGKVRKVGICDVCACAMHSVPSREMGESWEHTQRHSEGLSGVFTAKTVPELVLCESATSAGSLYKPKESSMAQIWGTRNTVSVSNSLGCLRLVGFERSGGAKSATTARSHRERRALRTREHTNVYGATKLRTYKQTTANPMDACIQVEESYCSVCGCHITEVPQNPNGSRDRGAVGDVETEGQTRVWDIINAGPLHRFTVQGVLVKNCVVIDYIDLLGSIPGMDEKRDSIDETWARMRGISQEYHCLVVTASQSNAAGYKAETLGMENFNGSRTQNDHVTALISLNQTPEEHELGLVRWHMTANRDSPENRQVMVAGCRAVGSPMILSKFCQPAT